MPINPAPPVIKIDFIRQSISSPTAKNLQLAPAICRDQIVGSVRRMHPRKSTRREMSNSGEAYDCRRPVRVLHGAGGCLKPQALPAPERELFDIQKSF